MYQIRTRSVKNEIMNGKKIENKKRFKDKFYFGFILFHLYFSRRFNSFNTLDHKLALVLDVDPLLTLRFRVSYLIVVSCISLVELV